MHLLRNIPLLSQSTYASHFLFVNFNNNAIRALHLTLDLSSSLNLIDVQHITVFNVDTLPT